MQHFWLTTFWLGIACATVSAAEPSREALEFFEKSVRPVLVDKCQKCHGEKQHKGGLRLDSIAAVLKGGDMGPAIVPGEPKRSLLVDAINYDPAGYQMPPTGKLSDDAIAALTEWVRLGAPWPADSSAATMNEKKFDLRERAKHWSFQPLRHDKLPAVQNAEWPRNPIDCFILSRLETSRLHPSEPAELRTFLRRVTLELTGLPPTPDEIDAFLADSSPNACERVVERLLASPRYGERWARHWLDLVRFAETGGHEFDYDIRHTWLYRDYVIRALNADVPYQQFVREHIAGDLSPQPRRDAATRANESVVGTAFYWFSQGKHSPVDLRAEECDTVDNQLDVLGKTFLGLTVACARCHDHKFDPITQHDYYALAGFLQSSRQTYADVAPPEPTTTVLAELDDLTNRSQADLWRQSLKSCQELVDRLPELLFDGMPPQQTPLPADFVASWRKTLHEEALQDRGHPFHLWTQWSKSPEQIANRAMQWQRESKSPDRQGGVPLNPSLPVGTLEISTPWFYEGRAFHRTDSPGLIPLWNGPATRPLSGVVALGTVAHSGTVSRRLQGTQRSPTFTITTKFIDYLACRHGGERTSRPLKDGQVHLIIDGFQYIKNPLYGQLSLQIAESPTPKWHRQDVSKFLGSRAYIEIEDYDAGEIVVEQLATHDGERPAEPFHPLVARKLATASVRTLQDLAKVYQSVCGEALESLRREQLDGTAAFPEDDLSAGASLMNWLCRQPTLSDSKTEPSKSAADFVAARAALDAKIPLPQYTIAMTDGSAENEHLLIRGNAHKPGDEVPRRFLEVATLFRGEVEGLGLRVEGREEAKGLELRAEGQKSDDARSSSVSQPLALSPQPHFDPQPSTLNPQPPRGSGRLQLADAIVDPSNPLAARVIVNRLWQHHFGRGIVPTPDDFGKMGQPPSHPELLDWLANELIRNGWSLKHIQRLIVTSQTYRMTSRATDSYAAEVDPENKLLHRMNVQRLEAEAIRDALLALSGRLDDRLGGPSVPPHLTPFMEGRGRPGQSGPLDGAGRRSIYLNVRRNFLPPLFLAFDFPTPFTTMGRRTTSNVPAQALALMNNPFVAEQAAMWARQLMESSSVPSQRVSRLYVTAFGREPTTDETAAALSFIATQSAAYGRSDDPRAWQDLAHVLLNVKEFVFVE